MKKKLPLLTTGIGVLLGVFSLMVSNFELRFGMRFLGRVISHRKMICPYCEQEVSVLEIQTSHSCPHCGEKIDTV